MGYNSSGDEASWTKYSQLHLNSGFLSPMANEKSSTQDLGFSPSIFLSRPDSHNVQPSIPSPQSSTPIPTPKPDLVSNSVNHDRRALSRHFEQRCRGSSSSSYDGDFCVRRGTQSDDPHGSNDVFATSTPIRDKENLGKRRGSVEYRQGGWSPTILHSGGRKHLQDANDVSCH